MLRRFEASSFVKKTDVCKSRDVTVLENDNELLSGALKKIMDLDDTSFEVHMTAKIALMEAGQL